jgi:hypothetical protein
MNRKHDLLKYSIAEMSALIFFWRNTILLFEDFTEMSGVAKTPLKGYACNTVFNKILLGKEPPALLQPLIQYVMTDRETFFSKEQMQVSG